MEQTKEYFETWLKSQKEFVNEWVESAQKIPQAFWGMNLFKGGQDNLSGNGDGLFNVYKSWFNEMIKALVHARGLNTEVLKDTLSKLTSSSNVYMKFYEIWLPISQAIQERASDPKLYKDLVDPVKYQEAIDKIFGFSPDTVTEFIKQASNISEALGVSTTEFGLPWVKASEKNLKMAPDMADARPETHLHVFHNLFRAFDDTIGKVFHIPPVGKDREKIELIMRGFDDLAVFLAKNTEYQHTIYLIAIRAMEKVLETIALKIKDGEGFKTFDEFFDLWMDVNEREYYDLFRNKEFSKLQGELLDAAINVRGHFYQLMELYLFDFPVALRSEMDDLYKTVYDLKKKVRGLEQQLGAVKMKEAAA